MLGLGVVIRGTDAVVSLQDRRVLGGEGVPAELAAVGPGAIKRARRRRRAQ